MISQADQDCASLPIRQTAFCITTRAAWAITGRPQSVAAAFYSGNLFTRAVAAAAGLRSGAIPGRAVHVLTGTMHAKGVLNG